MVNENYRKGANFEYRFVKKIIRDGLAVRSGRFFASKGITDVWWVDWKGKHNEAQLKFSSKQPYISPQELRRVKSYARNTEGQILVWLVKQQARKKIQMERVFA